MKEIWKESDFFFIPPESYDQAVIRKRWKDTPAQLMELRQILDDISDMSATVTEETVKAWITEKGYKIGDVIFCLETCNRWRIKRASYL